MNPSGGLSAFLFQTAFKNDKDKTATWFEAESHGFEDLSSLLTTFGPLQLRIVREDVCSA